MLEEIRPLLYFPALIITYWYGVSVLCHLYGWKTENYKQRPVPFSLGLVLFLSILTFSGFWAPPDAAVMVIYIGMIWSAGWLDDVWGGSYPKGIKGHLLLFLKEHQWSTGFIKIIVTMAAALIAAVFLRPFLSLEFFVISALFLLSPHVTNLLDTRPLRVWKWTMAHGGIIVLWQPAVLTWDSIIPLSSVIVLWAAAESSNRSMLGDNGAAAAGGLIAWAGAVWLPLSAQIILAAGYAFMTLLAEKKSIHAIIRSRPLLHWIDQRGWKE
ncbi:hypothetical protein [Salibacterium aidingense]|uniref:hypothetical protein n=1 Tax=Salibacterium aidingense TaxID=384933 RepID=UPI003BE475F2